MSEGQSRKHDESPDTVLVRSYEYGCLRPTCGEEQAINQMERRVILWNKLVEIETRFRGDTREILEQGQVFQTLSELRTREKELVDAVKRLGRQKRSGTVDLGDLGLDLARTRAELRQRNEEARLTRLERKKQYKLLLLNIEQKRREEVRDAIASSGLYWPNSSEVWKHYQVARQRQATSWRPLRFHGFNGSGKICLKPDQGLPVERLFDLKNGIVRVKAVPPEAHVSQIRSVRRKAARSILHFRVGSGEKRKPQWLEVPFVFHRALPAGAVIKYAFLIRTKIALDFRWKVVFIVKESRPLPKPQAPMIAIDVGWRLLPEGLRVAYWCDQRGGHGELVLPSSMVRQFQKISDLQSIILKMFNDARRWLATQAGTLGVADSLGEEAKSCEQWRSPERMLRFANRARDAGFTCPELSAYARRYLHLRRYKDHLLDQMIRQRRELFRRVARRLTGDYGTIIFQDIDLRKTAQVAPKKGEFDERSSHRMIAAPGEFRTILRSTARNSGTRVQIVPHIGKPVPCHSCGFREDWSQDFELVHRCGKCHSVWDQDYNLAVLLLKGVEFNHESAKSADSDPR